VHLLPELAGRRLLRAHLRLRPLLGRHAYSECSAKGICDRGSGICKCFDGYEGKGCRRSACPNKCSGHGRCVFNRDVHSQSIGGLAASSNGYDGYNLEAFTSGFDADKSQQCMCDRGWEDVDCSSRICPKGDDPLTDCVSKNQKDDVQLILFRGEDDFDLVNNAQFFTLTFTDMFNGNYTTYPIQLQSQATSSGGALCGDSATVGAQCHAGTDTAIKTALKALPNFAIPDISVQYQNMTQYRSLDSAALGAAQAATIAQADLNQNTPNQFKGAGDTGDEMASLSSALTTAVITGFLVTFSDDATSGYQNTMDCYVGSNQDSDEPAAQPRFGLAGSTLGVTCAVIHVGEPVDNKAFGSTDEEKNVADSLGIGLTKIALTGTAQSGAPSYANTLIADLVPFDSNSGYKEHAACSNRGACDGSSGLCECYDGFTGESCNTQHAFF